MDQQIAGDDSVRQRRFQFSLRTLLLLLSLSALPFAWFAHCKHKRYRVNATFRDVHECGGKVHLRTMGRFLLAEDPDIAFVDFPNPCTFADDGIPLLRKLGNVQGLSLRNTKVSRDGLSQLKSLSGLKRLDLRDTTLDDVASTWIREIEGLESLDVRNTLISDVAMREFAKISTLRALHVSGDGISDDGVLLLSGHPALEVLNLSDTRISDRGIAVAGSLPQLRTLFFARTLVSNAGLKATQEAPLLSVVAFNGSNVKGNWQALLRKGVSWRPYRTTDSLRQSEIFRE